MNIKVLQWITALSVGFRAGCGGAKKAAAAPSALRFRVFLCLKKPIAEGKKSHLTGKAFWPIPAEPMQSFGKTGQFSNFGGLSIQGKQVNNLLKFGFRNS